MKIQVQYAGLINDLIRDEGERLKVYDDKTGIAITRGTKVAGHPTIGVGRSLDSNGITEAESRYLLLNDIANIEIQLTKRLSWFNALDDIRQRALINMAFNLGVDGLLSFATFIGFLSDKQWVKACSDLESTDWYREVGPRAVRICKMISTGSILP